MKKSLNAWPITVKRATTPILKRKQKKKPEQKPLF